MRSSNLNLAKGNSLGITVRFKANAEFAAEIKAVVKQSNDFNDTSGTANLFEEPAFPSITVHACTVTISGTLYRDTDGNGTGDSVLTTARTVSVGGSSSESLLATGTYTFTVPKNGTYTVCVSAASTEVQTKPNVNSPDPGNNACTSVDGYSLQSLTANSTGNDFALAGGVTATCDAGATLESQLESGDASVKARITTYDASCKAEDKQFVFTTYSNGAIRTANLSPVSPTSTDCEQHLGTGAGCQIVAEVITWTLSGDGPDTKTLTYDDTAQGGSSGAMKFCLKDPFDRSASDGLTLHSGTGYFPANILPSGQSTCLARSTQGKFLVGSAWVSQRVDEVYSAFDGKISFG